MGKTLHRIRKPLSLAALSLFLLGKAPPLAFSSPQERDHAQMHPHPAPVQAAPPDFAKLEADKRFSEFNHRFAGIFVLLVGLLALLEPRLAERMGWVRYLWSLLFFLPGLYLFIWSDPESWPVGSQTLHHVLTQNTQVLQHKIFSLLLLGLGTVEFIRVRKNLRSVWVAALFPILAAIGALLLFYHSPLSHAGGMNESAHRAMQKVEQQHIGFAIVGFGIALSKAFADRGRFHPRLMRNLFAVLMIVLAVLLLTYTE